MYKYPGTYLSQLPPDLIKELDKIQDYVNKNEEFRKICINLTRLLNKYYQDTDYYAVQLLINRLNGFLPLIELNLVLIELVHNKVEKLFLMKIMKI